MLIGVVSKFCFASSICPLGSPSQAPSNCGAVKSDSSINGAGSIDLITGGFSSKLLTLGTGRSQNVLSSASVAALPCTKNLRPVLVRATSNLAFESVAILWGLTNRPKAYACLERLSKTKIIR